MNLSSIEKMFGHIVYINQKKVKEICFFLIYEYEKHMKNT